MKKINLYIAMLAMGMCACTEEDFISQTADQYSLNAEILNGEDSRMSIGAPAEGSHFSPINWDSDDSFLAFKSVQTIDKGIVFGLSEGEGTSKGVFATENAFKAEDITYAILPDAMVDKETTGESLIVQATSKRSFGDCQNAIMLGKYDAATKTMKFQQTMALLEMTFESFDDIDGVKIESDKNISVGGEWGTEAILNIAADGTGTVEIPAVASASKSIVLEKGWGTYTSKKLYCALPVGNDYGFIKIFKGKKQKKTVGYGFELVFDETPLKTIKAKTEGGKFTLGKKLYPVNCAAAAPAPVADPEITYMSADPFSPGINVAPITKVTDESLITKFGKDVAIYSVNKNLGSSFFIDPKLAGEWEYSASIGTTDVTSLCLLEEGKISAWFSDQDGGIQLKDGETLQIIIKDKKTQKNKLVVLLAASATPDPTPVADPIVTYWNSGMTELLNAPLTEVTDEGLIQEFGKGVKIVSVNKNLSSSFDIDPKLVGKWEHVAFIDNTNVTDKCMLNEGKLNVWFSEESDGIQLADGETLQVIFRQGEANRLVVLFTASNTPAPEPTVTNPVVSYVDAGVTKEAALTQTTDQGLIQDFMTDQIFSVDKSLSQTFEIDPKLTGDWDCKLFIKDQEILDKCKYVDGKVQITFSSDASGIVLPEGQELQVLFQQNIMNQKVIIFK